jgi:hypothetical protein
MFTSTTAALNGADQYTDSIRIVGSIALSISGTFVATVTVQRSQDNATWFDVDTFTDKTEKVGNEAVLYYYRAGIKTGEYTSGTATVSLYGSYVPSTKGAR